jgi:uncharacterized protein (DUF2267 family)
MDYQRFIQEVMKRTGAPEDQALSAVSATLETLGERLDPTHRSHLAAQLVHPLKHMVIGKHRTDRYSLGEFYNRVRARAELSYPQAIQLSRAVASVLGEAVAEGEIRDILAQLPTEYEELFGKEPASPLSPTTEGV